MALRGTDRLVVEVEASEVFGAVEGDEHPEAKHGSATWRYCLSAAAFVHREACEFVFSSCDAEYVWKKAEEMEQAGCATEFVAAYREAAGRGADFVLFYA